MIHRTNRQNLLLKMVLLALAPLALSSRTAAQNWKFDTQEDLKRVAFYSCSGNRYTHDICSEVKTPDGHATLKLSILERAENAPMHFKQVNFFVDTPLKAGKKYRIEFWCKGSKDGEVNLAAAMAKSPYRLLGKNSYREIHITEQWRKIVLEFSPSSDWNKKSAVPRFMLGKYPVGGDLYLGPVTFREPDKQLPLNLNREWKLFLRPKHETTEEPTEIKPVMVRLKENSINIGALAGSFKAKDRALLFNEFTSSEDGVMRIGVAADWWLTVYSNGKKVFSTIPIGNESHALVPNDHVFDLPVKSGRNVMAVEVLSGSNGWRFVCGKATREPDSKSIFKVQQSALWKPVNMGKIQVQPGTALDLSTIAGRRLPAGSLGRVIGNPAGHLAFERAPEKPVHFLGFNSSLGGFPLGVSSWDKKEISDYADAIARQGYNIVRLQMMELFLLGPKRGWRQMLKTHKKLLTFADVGIPQNPEDIAFDRDNCDRFDYFLACLKKNGVYVNLDLMASPTGYSMAFKCKPAEGFKVQLFLNPKYRRHWEIAVTYLLNHKNPYTGIRLKDDPVLAVVEPCNEQDLRLSNQPLMHALTPLFREYLQKKYKTDPALRNAWNIPGISIATVPDISEEDLRKGDKRADDSCLFLIQTMQNMNRYYFNFLRKSGYPGLITQWDMIMRTMEIPVRAQMPVIAQHTYFAHPNKYPSLKLVEKDKHLNNMVAWGAQWDIGISQNSAINSTYFRAAAAIRFLDRPFMITEYSHGSFNRYRHERGLYFGAYAALQGWDSLAVHSYSSMAAVKASCRYPFMGFENAIDPISRASETIVAFAWLREDVREASHSVRLKLTDQVLFPKHILSAIGDDYAKLAMLTKLGINYSETKPLMPVGESKASLTLTPTEFSSLAVNQWYVSASSKDGNKFPTLVAALKSHGILPAGNSTDPSKKIYQSETNEILLDGMNETMTVVCPRLEGAIIKKNTPVKLGCLEILSCSKPATVALVSLNREKAIADAKHLLLIFSTNALNTDMTFKNPKMQLMIDVGKLPVLIETARLSIRVSGSSEKIPVIYALNMDGTRGEIVPCRFDGGKLALDLDTSKLKYGTPYFELVFPE